MSDLKITLEIPVFTKFLTGTLLGEKVFRAQAVSYTHLTLPTKLEV